MGAPTTDEAANVNSGIGADHRLVARKLRRNRIVGFAREKPLGRRQTRNWRCPSLKQFNRASSVRQPLRVSIPCLQPLQT